MKIIISKGKKAQVGPVHTRDITLRDIWKCFFPKKGFEFNYLGYAYYYPKSGEKEQIIKRFLQEVDKVAKPWWCPRFIMRLLHLFGDDNSIVRCRNRRLSQLHYKLRKGITIHDMKWKYESFRIYGSFTDDLHTLAKNTCDLMEEEDAKNK